MESDNSKHNIKSTWNNLKMPAELKDRSCTTCKYKDLSYRSRVCFPCQPFNYLKTNWEWDRSSYE